MGAKRNRSRTGQQAHAEALPRAIVQTFRYPEPVAEDFTPTQFCRLRRTDLLGHYRRRLSTDRIAAERAELARLWAKYEDVTPTVDASVLGTMTAPTSVPSRDLPSRRPDSGAQLTLGLGRGDSHAS